MAAAPLDLDAYNGEDYEARGTHKSSRAPASSVVDISGWTIKFTVRAVATSPDALLSVDATLTAPTTGQYTIPLTAAQTAALGVGRYPCDVWRTDDGFQTEMAIGFLNILQSVRNP
jgi:hypothetical protein